MREIRSIIYFLDSPYDIGGSSKVLLTQAFIMKQRGYHVRVVIPTDRNGQYAPEYDKLCLYYGLEIMTANYPIATRMENIDIMDALDKYVAIVQLLRTYKPDFIHSVQLNIAVELAARELCIPHLMNIYQIERQAFYVNWMKVYPQYHCADSILISKRWGEGLGIPTECIRVAYSEKENERKFYEWNRKEIINIVSIGIVDEHKNQLEIIKFILKCKENHKNVRLTILGALNTAYADICKKFIEENELQKEVMMTGFVLNVEDYLKQADLFILASVVESYPGVIVESMANRVPVISTAVAGVPELLKDEQNGFLTTGNKAEDIYEAFLRFLQYLDSREILQVVENAYATYLKHHTYGMVGEQLEKYYRWIVEDYRNRNISYLEAGEIIQKFEKFIDEKKIDRSSRMLMRRIWLLYHILCTLSEKGNRKIAIWGAGYWGAVVFDLIATLEEHIEFIGFIDTKKSGQYLGCSIAQPQKEMIEKCDIILVAIADKGSQLEIMSYLDKCEKERNRDYFLLFHYPNRI